jgi:hypothetical protein
LFFCLSSSSHFVSSCFFFFDLIQSFDSIEATKGGVLLKMATLDMDIAIDFDLEESLNDNMNKIVFDFEKDLSMVLGEDVTLSGEDNEVCKFFLKGTCMKGSSCPFRHSRGEKAVVCKHWLRSLCKKVSNFLDYNKEG